MISSVHGTQCLPLQRCRHWLLCSAAILMLCAALAGCSTTPKNDTALKALQPLKLGDRLVTLEDAALRVLSPPLLTIDDDMREFLERYVGRTPRARQRLMTLHEAIKGRATLGVDYDPLAGGSAAEVFHRGSANCLSYASLFVAMAREVGLDARYQWLDMRPQWTRKGERVMVRLHVNVAIKLRGNEQYMVDIDPLQSRDIAGSRLISDVDARALNHSNIAMEALAVESIEEAWLQAITALQLSPEISHLWVNLGAIYRAAGQFRAAESSYQRALELDPWERSAMNNLAVLYSLEGRTAEQDFWEKKVARYRENNPYYHAWLGDQAGEVEDWQQALQNYQRALSLLPGDSGLRYALGMIYAHLGELEVAASHIERAIESATLRSQIKAYQVQLEALQRRQLAGF